MLITLSTYRHLPKGLNTIGEFWLVQQKFYSPNKWTLRYFVYIVSLSESMAHPVTPNVGKDLSN